MTTLLMRKFGEETGAYYLENGEGVCHPDCRGNICQTRDVIIGADSHSVTGGALGAFQTGMGSSDATVGYGVRKKLVPGTGTSNSRSPEVFKKGSTRKDLILHLIGKSGRTADLMNRGVLR